MEKDISSRSRRRRRSRRRESRRRCGGGAGGGAGDRAEEIGRRIRRRRRRRRSAAAAAAAAVSKMPFLFLLALIRFSRLMMNCGNSIPFLLALDFSAVTMLFILDVCSR